MLRKYYRLGKVFNIFDEIDDNHYKLHMYNSRSSNMINRKNEMLVYLKIIELKLINMLSTSSVFRKISNANYKGYVNEILNEEMNSGDTCHARAIIDSFKFKNLESMETEEPIEREIKKLNQIQKKLLLRE